MTSASDPDASSRRSDLPARIAGGEPLAEAELVERFRPGLLVMLRHRLRDRHLAEDACQDTLRIAIENLRIGALREPERLAAYLCGIAANVARREYRRLKRAAPDGVRVEVVAEATAPSGESALELRERSERIRRVLLSLSARDRELLSDFYLREREKSDVCRRLGLSPDQFDVVKFRALRSFERLWSQYAEGDDRQRGGKAQVE